jgi:U3 small nucleolar RNA-associated protein 4
VGHYHWLRSRELCNVHSSSQANGPLQRTVSSQGGTIWSLAANPSSDRIALGCDDGAVRILSLDDNSLEHHRRLDRTKARLLSIAWGPASRYPSKLINEDHSEDEEDSWRDSWLVAGCSDSCLRKFDLSSGRVLERMSVDKAKNQRTLVWSVGCLR